MPANAPYPGESEEEFLIRMMQEQGGGMPAPQVDPRIQAVDQLMQGSPHTVGPEALTTGPRAPGPPPDQFGIYGNRRRGNQPIEESLTYDKNFGGDASIADAFGGGYDQYAGGNYPPSPMQMRNRRVMHPEMSEDDHEQAEMQENYSRNTDPESVPERPEFIKRRMRDADDDGIEDNTQDDNDDNMLDMVQGSIQQKMGGDISSNEYGFTGELQNDIAALKSIGLDGYELMQAVAEFVDRHGEEALPPEFQEQGDEEFDDERDSKPKGPF